MSEKVARAEDIPEGGMLRCSAGGREVALARIEGEVFAFDANCPHRKGPLDSGDIEDHVVTCPWHGWRFDVRTGKSATHPGQIACFAVEVRDGDVYLGPVK